MKLNKIKIDVDDEKSLDIEPLKHVKPTYNQYREQLNTMAACNMIKQLGEPGVFGVAYASPNDPRLAVKTYKMNAKYPDYQWDAYTQYLMQVMNRKHNPYFPKIYDVQIFACTSGRGRPKMYGVVHMEKLYPIGKDYRKFYPFNDPEYDLSDPDQFNDPDRMFFLLKILRGKDPALYDTINLIHRLADNHSFTLDTHEANVMWRGTGPDRHLVFTDPLAW